MPGDASSGPPPGAAGPGDRVRFLLDAVWRNNQRAMARDLGVTQGLVSKVVNGVQSPGPRLLAALARHPTVSEEWVYSGTGDPLRPLITGTLPVAVGVLPGWPDRCPGLLTGDRHPAAAAFERPSRYWVRVDPGCPLLSDPGLALLPNDLLLMDADPAVWAGRLDQMVGRVFGVSFKTSDGPPAYVLARLARDERGLVFDLYPVRLRPAPPPRPPADPFGPVRRRVRLLKHQLPVETPSASGVVATAPLPVEGTYEPGDVVAVRVYTGRP